MEGAEDSIPNQHQKSSRITTETSQLTRLVENQMESNLPFDIINQKILTEMDVKTLGQFKSVSKAWLAMISSPKFIKDHLHRLSQSEDLAHLKLILKSGHFPFDLKICPLGSLSHDSITNLVDAVYPMKHPQNFPLVMGSCNGLTCICLNESDMLLCNLSTRESKRLPTIDFKVSKSRCYRAYGLGYDEESDDYKFVCYIHYLHDPADDRDEIRSTEAKIYSLRSDTWRNIEDVKDMLYGYPGELINGKLHWLLDHNERLEILSFDMAKEVYGKLKGPCLSMDNPYAWYQTIKALKGLLCYCRDYSRVRVELWAMEEYGVEKSWFKLATIPYGYQLGRRFCASVVYMLENNEILIHFDWSKLGFFNPQNGSFRYLRTQNFGERFAVDMYAESLVSPLAMAGDKSGNCGVQKEA